MLQYQQYAMGWGMPQMDPMAMYGQSAESMLGMPQPTSGPAMSTRVSIMRDVPGPSGEIFTEEFQADVYLQDSSPDTMQVFMKA
jgi:hypothetical protein